MVKFSRYTLTFLLILFPYLVSAEPNQSSQDISNSSSSVFKNRYPDKYPRGSFLKWQLERLFYKNIYTENDVTPTVIPDYGKIYHPQKKVLVTWIGHSTLLYQCDGLNFITDPIFSDYASPLPPFGPKRLIPPGIPIEKLPHIDVVLISHNHYDHLDLPSLEIISKQTGGAPKIFVPKGVKNWLQENIKTLNTPENKDKVEEFNWDQSETVQGKSNNFNITFLSVHHWSARSLWDRNETLWGSWAITHPQFKFWFSGDLGYSQDSVDIGKKFGDFDLAAIDIGSYEPRWFMANYHINPDEAVNVFKDIHTKYAIGIHWGVFKLSDEPYTQPPKDLEKSLQEKNINPDRFIVLKVGETKAYKE